MNIGEIVKDSIRYPFSDWKPFLIFGLIIILSSIDRIGEALGIGMAFMFKWGIIGLLFSVLINGYPIRIMRASMAGFDELPNFDSWFDIIINGIKVFIVDIAYFIPLFLILFSGGLLGFSAFSMGADNSGAILSIFMIIAILYVVVAFPFYLMSLANLSFYEDLGSAFRFREILDKISNIGWDKFIIWYIVTTVISLILIVSGALIEVFSSLVQLKVIGVLLVSLIIIPIMIIFLFRSTALFYLSEDPGYLECENCGGYYELQVGESPEDFEKCQCGGNLKYSSPIPSDNLSDGSKSGLFRFINRKRNFILLGTLALVIIALPVIFSQSMPNNIITTEKTLIGSYDASQLVTSHSSGTFIVIPPGTTNVKIEYNLSWAPVETGNNGFEISGYNTNKTSHWGVPDNMNVIYNEGVSSFDENEDKNGIINIDDSAVKSIVISGNGVKGTVKVYAYKTKLAI